MGFGDNPLSDADLQHLEELMRRFRALKDLPEDHPKRVIWEPFWATNPAFMSRFWRHLPDPLANPGRPKGSGKVTEAMLTQMDEAMQDGTTRPTRAAKAIVGDVSGQKNRADTLVKVWKQKRGIK